MSGVGTQGKQCTVNIFRSIAGLYLLYSATNPVPLTKYSVLHIGMSL
jgi:hypothetical protein